MHEDELLAIPLEAQEALPPKLISLNARTSVDTGNQDLHVSKLGHHFVRGTDKREKIRPACRGEDKNAVRAQKRRVFDKKKDFKKIRFVTVVLSCVG